MSIPKPKPWRVQIPLWEAGARSASPCILYIEWIPFWRRPTPDLCLFRPYSVESTDPFKPTVGSRDFVHRESENIRDHQGFLRKKKKKDPAMVSDHSLFEATNAWMDRSDWLVSRWIGPHCLMDLPELEEKDWRTHPGKEIHWKLVKRLPVNGWNFWGRAWIPLRSSFAQPGLAGGAKGQHKPLCKEILIFEMSKQTVKRALLKYGPPTSSSCLGGWIRF